jgi:hypothetical protein
MSELRRINRSELSDRLKAAARWGVDTPILHNSQTIPREYTEAEPYTGSGEVIDSHGNVVDLEAIEKNKFKAIRNTYYRK